MSKILDDAILNAAKEQHSRDIELRDKAKQSLAEKKAYDEMIEKKINDGLEKKRQKSEPSIITTHKNPPMGGVTLINKLYEKWPETTTIKINGKDCPFVPVDNEKDEDKWLQIRQQGIGGSDAAAALGVSKWKSQYELFFEKTGNIQKIDNLRMRLGRAFEPALLQLFLEDNPHYTGEKPRGVIFHPEIQYLYINVDGIIHNTITGIDEILEIKTTRSFDGLSDDYYCQAQHAMLVTGCSKVRFYICEANTALFTLDVNRNETHINNALEIYKYFWQQNIVAGLPPAVEASTERLNYLFAKETVKEPPCKLPADFLADAKELQEITEQTKKLEVRADEIRSKFQLKMKNNINGEIEGEDGLVISWPGPKKYFKDEEFRKKYPELVPECQDLSSKLVSQKHKDLYEECKLPGDKRGTLTIKEKKDK